MLHVLCNKEVSRGLNDNRMPSFFWQDAQIINWLQEFRNCVTQLSKDHEQLIYVVLVRMEHLNQEMDSTAQARNSFLMLYLPLVSVYQRLPWLGRSPAVVEEYLAFLSNLVSAQTVYLRACLKMVVSNFTPSEFLSVCVDILITQYGYFEDVLFFLPFQREWRFVREEWISPTRMMTMKVGVIVSLLFTMENQDCSTDSPWNVSLQYTLQ